MFKLFQPRYEDFRQKYYLLETKLRPTGNWKLIFFRNVFLTALKVLRQFSMKTFKTNSSELLEESKIDNLGESLGELLEEYLLMKLFNERFGEITTKWLAKFMEKSSKEIQEKIFLKFKFWELWEKAAGSFCSIPSQQSVHKLLINFWRQSRKNTWSNSQKNFWRTNGQNVSLNF